MQVVILTGGKGTRLHPYTVSLPKPLVPVGDLPILEIVLRQLKRAGAGEIILSTGHFAELIQSYFGGGEKWGVHLRYVREETPLGTAGPLKLIEGLEDNFLVMNGDILTLLDFQSLWEDHMAAGASATIAVCERFVDVDFGVVKMDEARRLKEYLEKPRLSYLVSMGINVLSKRCLRHIEPGKFLGMPDLLEKEKAGGGDIRCYAVGADWLDIGRPEDYQAAQEKFQKFRGDYLKNG